MADFEFGSTTTPKSLYCEDDIDFLNECIKLEHDGMKNLNHWNHMRNRFFASFPENTNVIEIGVRSGKNAYRINKLLKPKKLVLVDPWDKYLTEENSTGVRRMENERCRNNVFNHFGNQPHVEIIVDYSLEAVKLYEDGFFDLVYIDGDHSKEAVAADLKHWSKKVKPGGFLAGHDYSPHSPVGKMVKQFMVDNGHKWRLAWQAGETAFYSDSSDSPSDFAIQRDKY